MALARKIEALIMQQIFRFLFEMRFSIIGFQKQALRGHLAPDTASRAGALMGALVTTFWTSKLQPVIFATNFGAYSGDVGPGIGRARSPFWLRFGWGLDGSFLRKLIKSCPKRLFGN